MKHFRHNCPPKINVKSIWRILLNLLAIRTAFGLSSSWRLQPLNFRGVHLLDRDYSNYNYCVRLLHDHHFGQTAEFLVQHHHTQRQRQRLQRRVHRTAYQLRSHDDFAAIRTSRCDDDRLSIVPEATFSPIRSSLAPEPLNYSTRRKIILSMLSWGGMASVTSLLSEGAEASSLFPDDVDDVSAFPPSSAFPPTNENEPLEGYQSIPGDKERYQQASSTRKKFRRNYHPLKTAVVQQLWDLDDNRLVPNIDYKINVQAGKTLRRKEPNSNSRTVNGNFSDDSESDSYGDVAPLPLFNYVNPSILSNKNSPPLQKQQDSQSASKSSKSYITYQLFLSLLDNYNADESIPETTTDQEYDEIMLFLNAVMDTRPMKFCHEYCYHRQIELMKKMVEFEDANGGEMQHTKGGAKKQNNEMIAIIPPDREGFIQLLYSIWFDYYRRQRPKNRKSSSVMGKNSCGFEHVFVGEVKPTRKRATSNLGTTDSVNATGKSDGSNDKGAVVGFHNWIQFYVEEMKGNLDYRGFIIRPATANRDGFGSEESNTASCPLDRNETVKSTIFTLQFQWNGSEKPLSTMFVGTSPEFEMALYTMAFLVGESNNRVTLNTTTDDDSAAGGVFDLNIKCFRIGAEEEEVEDPHDTDNENGANGIQWRIGSAFVEDMNHC